MIKIRELKPQLIIQIYDAESYGAQCSICLENLATKHALFDFKSSDGGGIKQPMSICSSCATNTSETAIIDTFLSLRSRYNFLTTTNPQKSLL